VSERGLAFDTVADEYERARRGYPDELVDAACALAGLAPGSRVLEVGAGTGKLTRMLVARGLAVDAVEPGDRLIAVAERHVGDVVRFHRGRFEDVDVPDAAFAALFSATAWHWVDPAVGWAKAARALEPGGTLVLLAHVDGEPTDVDRAIHAAWREIAPETARWSPRGEHELWAGVEARRANVSEVWSWMTRHELGRPEAEGLFADVRVEHVAEDVVETAAQLVALLRTTSLYLGLDEIRRTRLEAAVGRALGEAGGLYRGRLLSVLVAATRT
jgi:SAM-dependent methyltransferase